MAINNVGASATANNQPPTTTGADPKSPEGLQGRFDDIKAGKSENPKEDLKSLKKDVEEAQQKEESKAGGGDDKMMKLIEALLKMIMEMMKQMKGGGAAGAGGGEGGE